MRILDDWGLATVTDVQRHDGWNAHARIALA